MKRSILVASYVAIACTFPISPVTAADSREKQRLHERKITKNEAQHLVLKKYPNASIKSCELSGGKEHGVWVLQVVPAGANDPTEVKVDGRSGKILP
ncbi:MAG: PepSY domain-containing protein [Chthoniobacterales bacterium]|nr:PepSY domain-containing protein [Chthoniobacterales bacterium]